MCPIKDEKYNITMLPRVGKIHLGIKEISQKTGKEYPKAVEYFVFPEEWKNELIKAYRTDKPTKLPILLPVDDDEIWCRRYYKRYNSANDLLCWGDGEAGHQLVDTATGEIPQVGIEGMKTAWNDIDCDGMDCSEYGTHCIIVMNLQVILPDLSGLGVWQIDSKSRYGWRNIQATARLIRIAYGTVAMVPSLWLTLEYQDVRGPNRKKRSMPILNLRSTKTFKEMLLDAQAAHKQLARVPVYALSAPDESAPELLLPENQEPEEPSGQKPKEPPTGKPKVRKPRVKAEPTQAATETKKEEPAKQEPAKQEPPPAAKEPVKQEPAIEPVKKGTKGTKVGKASPGQPSLGTQEEDPDWTALKERQAKDGIQNWDDFFAYAFRIQAAGGATRVSVTAICGCLGVNQISEYKGTKEDALKELAKLNGVTDWRKL